MPASRSTRTPDSRVMWSAAVLAKYWALQVPGAALVAVVLLGAADHFAWPLWAVWTAVALWVVKDAVLYPFLWRAYYPSDPAALPFPLEGTVGVALDRIEPSGPVRVWGELWRARLAGGTRHIERGEKVRVRGRDGLTLLIEPGTAGS